jgi:hypothetical protein
MTITLTTKSALANLTTQAQGVRNAALFTTGAMVLCLTAYGADNKDKAVSAIRQAVIAAGMWKDDKGTKQPSNKARNFLNAAEQAFKLYEDKARSIIGGASDELDATGQLASWLNTFSLSGNLYEGGTFLLPLTRGISKKDAKALIAQKASEGEAAGEEDKVTRLPAKGKRAATATSTTQEAHKVLSATVTASSVLPMLKTLFSTKPNKDVSSAIVRMCSELDAINRLVRGEDVKSASKEVRALAVLAAKHGAFFAKNTKSENKALPQAKAIKNRAKRAA